MAERDGQVTMGGLLSRDVATVAGFAIVVVAISLVLTDSFHIRILNLFLLWAFAAAAWNITAKAGLISLGHSAFTGLGAYTFGLMLVFWDVSPWLGMFAAALAGAIGALIIGLPSLRLEGFYFVLATIAYPLILMLLVVYMGFPELNLLFQPDQSWYYLDFRNPKIYVWISLTLVVGIQLLVSWIERNRFGFYLRAIRDNEILARAVGIRTDHWKTGAFVLSGALTGVMSVIWVKSVLFVITAEQAFGLIVVIQLLSIVFVGGIASRWGPIIGAAMLVPLAALLDQSIGDRVPGVQVLVYGVALVFVALVAPEGVVWRARAWLAGRRTLSPEAVDDAAADDTPADMVKEAADVHGGQPAHRFVGSAVAVHDRSKDGDTSVDVPMLSLSSVTRRFGGITAVDDVSFSIESERLVGIIGPNGAGKTTLFNILTGYQRADAGTVEFLGEDIAGLGPPERYRLGISRTFQVPQGFQRMTPWENVLVAAMGIGAPSEERASLVTEALDFVGFTANRSGPLSGLTTLDFKLLEIARAVVSRPRLLLVDEPLAGLNPTERIKIIDVLRAYAGQEATVVIIEHSVRSLVTFVERIVALESGGLLMSGTPQEVVEDPRVIASYLGKKWSLNAEGRTPPS